MKRVYIPLSCVLVCAIGAIAYADVPEYSLQTFLPTPNCLSVDMAPDGTTIAAGGYADNNNGYRLFDARTYAVLGDFRPGLVSWTWRFSSDSQYLWAADYYGGSLAKIDVGTGERKETIDLGNWAIGATFDCQRRYLFVSENCPYGGAIGSVKEVDTQTNQVVGSVTLNGTPDHCKVLSPDGAYLYVASIYNYVHKIRTSDLTVVSSTHSSGIGGNNALSLSPSGDRLYVQTSSTNQVHVFDTSTMSELQSLTLPCISSGFYVSPDGSHGLMSEVGTSFLDVYSLATGSIVKKIDLSAYNTMPQSGIAAPYWDIDNGRVLCVSSEGIAVLTFETTKVVAIDIKPGSCPNPLNVKDRGLLSVAVCGSEDFDVRAIDVASILLEGVAPVRSSYEDVATRVGDGTQPCECTTAGPDGQLDLTLKFNVGEIVAALGQVNNGDELKLTLTGVLDEASGGTAIEGTDCIVIRGVK